MATTETVPIWKKRAVVLPLLWVILLAAVFLGTKFYKPGTEPENVNAGTTAEITDPTTYVEDNYDATIVPAITDRATDLVTVLDAIAADSAAAGADYGSRPSDNTPFAYPVTFTGTIGEASFGKVAITVDGVDPATSVYIATGPAIVSTAVRDATGLFNFGQFTNQTGFADVSIAINKKIVSGVLTTTDITTMQGKEVTVTGAFSNDKPNEILIVPVSIEAGNG